LNPNPPKRNAIAFFIITLFATATIFIPELIGIDGFDGGFAISFFGLFIAITAAAVGTVFLGWARKLDKILRGENILAHWIYTPEYWMEYAQKEYVQEKADKKGLFLVVCAFALFFGCLFWILDSEGGFFVFLVMLALIVLVWFAWQFSSWQNYKHNLNGVGEVYITKDALYLNRKFYTWKAPFTLFNGVSIENIHGIAVLRFKYTVSTRTGPQTYTTRVPIPEGQEEAAHDVLRQINMYN